ncbi:amino acid adenylation domain-containing protein [Kitasatospora sp. NPDC059673]|uniref:amino acid adenylation domain-containing protein n=1 Tax=Kitasatospora sp. NPDC059673 TaxID=3346901 RepID=UPI00367F765D
MDRHAVGAPADPPHSRPVQRPERPLDLPGARPCTGRCELRHTTVRLPRTGGDPLAALLLVLRKYTGADLIPLGRLDAAGRPLPAVEASIDPAATLAEFTARAAEALRTADGGTGPQSVLLADSPQALDAYLAAEGGRVPFDLAVCAAEDGAELRLDAWVHADAVDPALAEALPRHLALVLDALADRPTRRVADTGIISAPERDFVLHEVNATAVDYPRDASLHALFAEQAAAHPTRTALVGPDGETLDYAELDRRSARLAERLRAAGVAPGSRVALRAERTTAMVVATLAVLRAGAAYVPIDPGYPEDRVSYTVADSGAVLMLTADPGRPAPLPLLSWDTADGDPTGPDSPAAAEATAYVMYTSGTTGRPKGVPISHRNVVRLVRGSSFAELGPDTRVLQTGAPVFDAATLEIWGPLLNGGTLHLVDDAVILDARALGRAVRERGITTMWLTAALFNQLVDQDPALLTGLRELLVGGDALSVPHIDKLLTACPGLRVTNGYGPTENTTFSTTHLVTRPLGERIPIGRPIANSTAYVVDPDGALQAVGVPGELLVGGDGLTAGYLGRPDLDERAFVPDTFGGGGRLYRTGDRVRLLPDGALEFLGRVDHQVKIRGFRVEPAEVAQQLMREPGVREAVVVARQYPETGEKYLCGYVAADAAVDPAALRTALAARLPEHLVPARIVRLDALPLTRNGKVDRTALPLPETAAPDLAGYAAPRDDLERFLCEQWQQVLGRELVGLDDDFFDLGASSLTAAMLAGAIQREYAVDFSGVLILTHPTVREVAELLRTALAEAADGPAAAGARELPTAPELPDHPVTPQQKRLYVEQLKDPSTTQYHVPLVIDLPAGQVDATALEAALRQLIARHEVLRTAFVHDGEEPRQRVLSDVPFALERGARTVRELLRPFDLAEPPLLRAAFFRHGEHDRLLLNIHHIVADGTSVAVLLAELADLYRGVPLPEPKHQYRDYAHWWRQSGEALAEREHRPYWLELFAEPQDAADLPVDRARPATRGTAGDRIAFDLGPQRTARIRELAARRRVTVFGFLAAVHALFLSAVTGSHDVTAGVPTVGRTVPGTERLPGMFAGTVCLRSRFEPDTPFAEHLRAVADQAVQAFAHQDQPFDTLVELVAGERDYSRNPLFDAMLAFQGGGVGPGEFLGALPRFADTDTDHTMFDLNLQFHEAGESVEAVWAYSTDLFDRATAEAFVRLLLDLVDGALADPHAPVGRLIRPAAPTVVVSALAFEFDL